MPDNMRLLLLLLGAVDPSRAVDPARPTVPGLVDSLLSLVPKMPIDTTLSSNTHPVNTTPSDTPAAVEAVAQDSEPPQIFPVDNAITGGPEPSVVDMYSCADPMRWGAAACVKPKNTSNTQCRIACSDEAFDMDPTNLQASADLNKWAAQNPHKAGGSMFVDMVDFCDCTQCTRSAADLAVAGVQDPAIRQRVQCAVYGHDSPDMFAKNKQGLVVVKPATAAKCHGPHQFDVDKLRAGQCDKQQALQACKEGLSSTRFYLADDYLKQEWATEGFPNGCPLELNPIEQARQANQDGIAIPTKLTGWALTGLGAGIVAGV